MYTNSYDLACTHSTTRSEVISGSLRSDGNQQFHLPLFPSLHTQQPTGGDANVSVTMHWARDRTQMMDADHRPLARALFKRQAAREGEDKDSQFIDVLESLLWLKPLICKLVRRWVCKARELLHTALKHTPTGTGVEACLDPDFFYNICAKIFQQPVITAFVAGVVDTEKHLQRFYHYPHLLGGDLVEALNPRAENGKSSQSISTPCVRTRSYAGFRSCFAWL
jgi:hypothetical protein